MNLRDASEVSDLFDRAAQAMRESPVRDQSIVRLPAKGRLIATGDLHDNPEHLQKIMKLARPDQSPDHHVVLHEIIHSERLVNGMDFSHRMLARVAELVTQYPGQVHALLANHELSQMTGKGVSKGAGNSVELFNDGLDFAFGEQWQEVSDAIKRFIAAMPLALMSEHGRDGGVCCAHSLPAPHMMSKFDIDIIHRELQPGDYMAPAGSAHLMVWGRNHDPAQLDVFATAWSVKFFCLGHEHVDTGIELKGPRLIVINSDHERGAALPLNLAALPSPEEAVFGSIPLNSITLKSV